MKIYVVENGNYVKGYYVNPENAERDMESTNKLIEKLISEGCKHIDTTPVSVNVIETEG